MALLLRIPKQQVHIVVAAAAVVALGTVVATGTSASTSRPSASKASASGASVEPVEQFLPVAAVSYHLSFDSLQDPQTGTPGQGAQQQGQAPPPPVGADEDLLTQQEREALSLVEQIIRDQEGVLMGTGFDYEPGERRDPFMSLLVPSVGPDVRTGTRPAGLAGFLISEVDLKAIATAQGSWHGMVTGPDRRAYFLEVGTELFDGHVRDIRADEVIFEQQVPDFTGARRTREVTKRLRTDSGGGETP